jgi:DnaJ-class molecular chaperone
MPIPTDLYAVLNVSPSANPEQLRKAYKAQLLRCHPDKTGDQADNNAFNQLSAAYDILSSRSSRAEYDRTRAKVPTPADYVPSRPDDPFADFAFRKQFAEAFAQSVSAEEGRPVDSETLFASLFGRERAQYGGDHSDTTAAAAAAAESDARRAAAASSHGARRATAAESNDARRPTAAEAKKKSAAGGRRPPAAESHSARRPPSAKSSGARRPSAAESNGTRRPPSAESNSARRQPAAESAGVRRAPEPEINARRVSATQSYAPRAPAPAPEHNATLARETESSCLRVPLSAKDLLCDASDSALGSSASGDDTTSSIVEDDFTDVPSDSDVAQTDASSPRVSSAGNPDTAASTDEEGGSGCRNVPRHAPAIANSRSGDALRPKAPDHEVDLPLTLEEMFCGCVKKRRLRKQVIRKPSTGESSNDPSVLTEAAEILTINVHPGYKPGDKIRFREASDQAPGVTPADVVFVISQIPHKRYSVMANGDIKVKARIGLADALAGATINLETLSGQLMQIRTTEIITPGTVKTVRGKGMPMPQSTRSNVGDEHPCRNLLVIFDVDFPKALSEDEKLKVRTLFQSFENGSLGSDSSVSSGNASGNPSVLSGDNSPSMRRAASMFAGVTSPKRTRSSINPSASTNSIPAAPLSPRSSRLGPVRVSGNFQASVKKTMSSPRAAATPPRPRSDDDIEDAANISDTISVKQRKRGFLFFN